jgi:alpha-beta hydrolase superfamily lysophospholipase
VGELEKYYEDPMYHKNPICFLVAATALDVADTVRGGMEDWTVPTLVLHGDADPYCDWKASESFVQGVSSVDKEFGVYADGRHELLHDLEGGVVSERVVEWIRMHV